MQIDQTAEYVQLECVRFSGDGGVEIDQHRPIVSVPRAEILRIELVHGPGAEQPLVVIVLGLVCLALALLFPLMSVLGVTRGALRLAEWLIAGIALLVPAWWLLDLGIRRRWYVRVWTRGGSRKLVFHQCSDHAMLERFITLVRQRFGYS